MVSMYSVTFYMFLELLHIIYHKHRRFVPVFCRILMLTNILCCWYDAFGPSLNAASYLCASVFINPNFTHDTFEFQKCLEVCDKCLYVGEKVGW